MNASEQFAVLLIRTEESRFADALPGAVFDALSHIAITEAISEPTLPRPKIPNSSPQTSYSFTVHSPTGTKILVFKDFVLPPIPPSVTRLYLLWMLRMPVRSWSYLWHRIPELWREAKPVREKPRAIVTAGAELVAVAFETLFNGFTVPIITNAVIRPIRRLTSFAMVFYLFLTVFLFLAITWNQTLPLLVDWISQRTHEIVALVPGSGVTFEALFPITAGVFVALSIAGMTALVRVARWMTGWIESTNAADRRAMTELSYLADPLYAAILRNKCEREIADLVKAGRFQHIFVIGDHAGALLAHEVLCSTADRMSAPISLITHDLRLAAGFAPLSGRSLWLLVEPWYWIRFSQPTPRDLAWWHCSWGWLRKREFTIRFTSDPGSIFPHIQVQREKSVWFRAPETIVADRLLGLMHLRPINRSLLPKNTTD